MNKDFKELSLNITEEEYRKLEAYSYSKLSKFLKTGFSKLDALDEEIKSDSLTFGGLLDTLITSTEEEFNKKYIVTDIETPSTAVQEYVELLFCMYGDNCSNLEDIPREELLIVIKDYYKSWKDDTKYQHFIKSGKDYYYLLSLQKSMTVIKSSTFKEASECKEILFTDEAIKDLFDMSNGNKYFQLKFKGDYNNIPIKCMIDLCCVDHDTKTIKLYDLKTTYAEEYVFYNSFLKYNYFIQAQMYTEIVKQVIAKDDYFKDFKVDPVFTFIVISSTYKTPLLWNYNTENTDNLYGKSKQIKLQSWKDVLDELDYYLTRKPKYPKEINSENSIEQWLNKM